MDAHEHSQPDTIYELFGSQPPGLPEASPRVATTGYNTHLSNLCNLFLNESEIQPNHPQLAQFTEVPFWRDQHQQMVLMNAAAQPSYPATHSYSVPTNYNQHLHDNVHPSYPPYAHFQPPPMPSVQPEPTSPKKPQPKSGKRRRATRLSNAPSPDSRVPAVARASNHTAVNINVNPLPVATSSAQINQSTTTPQPKSKRKKATREKRLSPVKTLNKSPEKPKPGTLKKLRQSNPAQSAIPVQSNPAVRDSHSKSPMHILQPFVTTLPPPLPTPAGHAMHNVIQSPEQFQNPVSAHLVAPSSSVSELQTAHPNNVMQPQEQSEYPLPPLLPPQLVQSAKPPRASKPKTQRRRKPISKAQAALLVPPHFPNTSMLPHAALRSSQISPPVVQNESHDNARSAPHADEMQSLSPNISVVSPDPSTSSPQMMPPRPPAPHAKTKKRLPVRRRVKASTVAERAQDAQNQTDGSGPDIPNGIAQYQAHAVGSDFPSDVNVQSESRRKADRPRSTRKNAKRLKKSPPNSSSANVSPANLDGESVSLTLKLPSTTAPSKVATGRGRSRSNPALQNDSFAKSDLEKARAQSKGCLDNVSSLEADVENVKSRSKAPPSGYDSSAEYDTDLVESPLKATSTNTSFPKANVDNVTSPLKATALKHDLIENVAQKVDTQSRVTSANVSPAKPVAKRGRHSSNAGGSDHFIKVGTEKVGYLSKVTSAKPASKRGRPPAKTASFRNDFIESDSENVEVQSRMTPVKVSSVKSAAKRGRVPSKSGPAKRSSAEVPIEISVSPSKSADGDVSSAQQVSAEHSVENPTTLKAAVTKGTSKKTASKAVGRTRSKPTSGNIAPAKSSTAKQTMPKPVKKKRRAQNSPPGSRPSFDISPSAEKSRSTSLAKNDAPPSIMLRLPIKLSNLQKAGHGRSKKQTESAMHRSPSNQLVTRDTTPKGKVIIDGSGNNGPHCNASAFIGPTIETSRGRPDKGNVVAKTVNEKPNSSLARRGSEVKNRIDVSKSSKVMKKSKKNVKLLGKKAANGSPPLLPCSEQLEEGTLHGTVEGHNKDRQQSNPLFPPKPAPTAQGDRAPILRARAAVSEITRIGESQQSPEPKKRRRIRREPTEKLKNRKPRKASQIISEEILSPEKLISCNVGIGGGESPCLSPGEDNQKNTNPLQSPVVLQKDKASDTFVAKRDVSHSRTQASPASAAPTESARMKCSPSSRKDGSPLKRNESVDVKIGIANSITSGWETGAISAHDHRVPERMEGYRGCNSDSQNKAVLYSEGDNQHQQLSRKPDRCSENELLDKDEASKVPSTEPLHGDGRLVLVADNEGSADDGSKTTELLSSSPDNSPNVSSDPKLIVNDEANTHSDLGEEPCHLISKMVGKSNCDSGAKGNYAISCGLCHASIGIHEATKHPFYSIRGFDICNDCRTQVSFKLKDNGAIERDPIPCDPMTVTKRTNLLILLAEEMVHRRLPSQRKSANLEEIYNEITRRDKGKLRELAEALPVPYDIISVFIALLKSIGVRLKSGALCWPSGIVELPSTEDVVAIIGNAMPRTFHCLGMEDAPGHGLWKRVFGESALSDISKAPCRIYELMFAALGVQARHVQDCKRLCEKNASKCRVQFHSISVAVSMYRAEDRFSASCAKTLYSNMFSGQDARMYCDASDLELENEVLWGLRAGVCCSCGGVQHKSLFPFHFTRCTDCPRQFCSICLCNVFGANEYIRAKNGKYCCLSCRFKHNASRSKSGKESPSINNVEAARKMRINTLQSRTSGMRSRAIMKLPIARRPTFPLLQLSKSTRQDLLRGSKSISKHSTIGFAKFCELQNDRMLSSGRSGNCVNHICMACKLSVLDNGTGSNCDLLTAPAADLALDGIVACTVEDCKNMLHQQCMPQEECTRRRSTRAGWQCPQHKCSQCEQRDEGKLVRCYTCPIAYCREHFPSKSEVFIFSEKVIACPRCRKHLEAPARVFTGGTGEAARRQSLKHDLAIALAIDERKRSSVLEELTKVGTGMEGDGSEWRRRVHEIRNKVQ